VHPSTLLLAWLMIVATIQVLDIRFLIAALLLLPVFGTAAWRGWRQLAWRARWLFLSLVVILSWGGIGDPVWNGPLAPSRQGLLDAGTHAGRLLLILMAVVVLRQRLPVTDLLTAIHRLLGPLHRCGLDVDRAIVRLLLVLNYLDTLPRPRDWKSLLANPGSHNTEAFELADRRLSRRDYLLLALLLLGCAPLLYFSQI